MILGLCQSSHYILLDEPFNGLDIIAAEQVMMLVKQAMYEGKGILITTHNIAHLDYIVDKVLALKEGQIVSQFLLEDVRLTEGLTLEEKLREVLE